MDALVDSKYRITIGGLRAQGVTRLQVVCRNDRCGHFSVIHNCRWRDDVRLLDAELSLICSACKAKGGELSPAPRIVVAGN